jgi:integrase/recombinase XerC
MLVAPTRVSTLPMEALIPAPVGADALLPTRSVRPTIPEALETELCDLPSGESQKTYRKDLGQFTEYLKARSPAEAVALLVRDGQAAARMTAKRYLTSLRRRGLKPNTLNHHLAALKFAVRVVRACDIIDWALDIKARRADSYRDLDRVTLSDLDALLAVAGQRLGIRAYRDPALLRCLFALGLRRAEVSSLDIENYRATERLLEVAGKGHGGARAPMTVPPATAAAIDTYLAARGYPSDGPLFENCDRSKKGKSRRLTGAGVHYVVCRLAREAELTVRVSPHRIRHTSIRMALDKTHGDVRQVQEFSRHAKVETVMIYDKLREDTAGKIAALLDSAVGTVEVATNAQTANLSFKESRPERPVAAPVSNDKTSSRTSSEGAHE